ncbi:type II toxin-antitoxin system RatA family toxin [Derxia lacustris]|uniref:type II toxin-antitoxin system RatA family toxin n=1 Tax=Derxia lacustris TaxID=764842 RepID=UPI000A178387|nr:type II toxin-antitoxin system RatA family toxin [Derxia lacustris]
MAVVERSVLVAHPAQRMYDLVTAIEQYPKFLPWCGGARVLSREQRADGSSVVLATIEINFKGVRQSFTTQNVQTPASRIDMQFREGPFRMLEGDWRFVPLADDACKVSCRIEYEFASRLLESLVGPVFNHVAGSFVDGFVKRADQLYD